MDKHNLIVAGNRRLNFRRHGIVHTSHALSLAEFSTCSPLWRATTVIQAGSPRAASAYITDARREASIISTAQHPENSSRSDATSTSLGQTALDARPARLPTSTRRRRRHQNLHNSTRVVTACCAAESYALPTARHLLRRNGFSLTAVDSTLAKQIIRAQLPTDALAADGDGKFLGSYGRHDIFVFSSGSVVAWNLSKDALQNITQNILCPAAQIAPLTYTETETFQYVELPDTDRSEIAGDVILLGTGAAKSVRSMQDQHALRVDHVDAVHVTLAKIAYSCALARSTKLAVLEELSSSYFRSTRNIPCTLSARIALPFTRSFILRKTGELLSIRAQLNLYSELTDSLPDLFWDSPHDLGLEECYESLGRALDVGVRIRALNQKMDYASEIAAVLRERLSEKHSTGLEWLIIGLISIEVAFGIFHLLKESQEQENLSRVRDLLEKYLAMELDRRRSLATV